MDSSACFCTGAKPRARSPVMRRHAAGRTFRPDVKGSSRKGAPDGTCTCVLLRGLRAACESHESYVSITYYIRQRALSMHRFKLQRKEGADHLHGTGMPCCRHCMTVQCAPRTPSTSACTNRTRCSLGHSSVYRQHHVADVRWTPKGALMWWELLSWLV